MGNAITYMVAEPQVFILILVFEFVALLNCYMQLSPASRNKKLLQRCQKYMSKIKIV